MAVDIRNQAATVILATCADLNQAQLLQEALNQAALSQVALSQVGCSEVALSQVPLSQTRPSTPQAPPQKSALRRLSLPSEAVCARWGGRREGEQDAGRNQHRAPLLHDAGA